MATIPDDIKEQIRHAMHLPDVLARDGVVITRGRARCPFEAGSRDRGKFQVWSDHYYCYGCQEKGDVFTWLQKKHGLDFREALKVAADLAGIDIDEYLRPTRRDADPRRKRAVEALHAVACLAREHALALPAEARCVHGVDVTPLIESGELGFMPDRATVQTHLTTLGVGADAIHDIGFPEAAAALANAWVLWARSKGHLYAGRAMGTLGPAIGPRRGRSSGWIGAPEGAHAARTLQTTQIAGDDALYIALRACGVTTVFRPTSSQDLAAPERLPLATSPSTPPILLVRPSPEARMTGLRDALVLLGANARLRAAEIDPLPPGLVDAGTWQASFERLLQRAGTVFDWQVHLLGEHCGFQGPVERRAAAERLARVVRAVRAPVERAIYQAELASLTGYRLEDGTLVAPSMDAGPAVETPGSSRSRVRTGIS